VESCLYTKNGSAFSSWNTKADGTGVKYNVGDTVSLGTKLYAQWVDNVLHVASYTVISSYPSTSLKVMMVSEIGSHSMFISTPFTSPAFIVLSGVTDIFYDQTASMFKYTDNGVKCTVKVTLTNADNVRYSIDEGNGVVYFSATKDIGVDLNIKKVISG
jgi:hypothetical protein